MGDDPMDGMKLEAARALAAARLFGGERARRDVLCWLARLGVPPRDRGDVAGQIWLQAWKSWRTFDPRRGSAARWLNRIAVHVVAHYHERARHRWEELMDDDLPDPVDPAPDAADAMASRRVTVRVVEALSELDPKLGAVVVSHDLEGIPMARVAEAAKLPLSTLYKHRARALAALRAVLEREDDLEPRGKR
ncbi:sigma-70 family RNA polymerase sigma factor [Sorangium sp. So ce448]|uniref:RNA polymerase sigma factor n=1 Tax=Sorangium sp. So ce448 TaxID=3133314 RepID=UPI003F61957D